MVSLLLKYVNSMNWVVRSKFLCVGGAFSYGNARCRDVDRLVDKMLTFTYKLAMNKLASS